MYWWGVNGESGSQMVILDASAVGPVATSVYRLEDPIVKLAVGNIDDDSSLDVGVLSGNRLFILHGRDSANLESPIEPLVAPFGVREFAIGKFRTTRGSARVAVWADDNTVRFLSSQQPAFKGARRSPVGRVRESYAPASGHNGHSRGRSPWITTALSRPSFLSSGPPVRLTASQILGSGADDLVVLCQTKGSIAFWRAASSPQGGPDQLQMTSTLQLDRPVDVLPMRLNVMASTGLVVLTRGALEPVATTVQAGVIYHVTGLGDSQSGNCTAPSGGPISSNCTNLRSAVICGERQSRA